MRIKMITALGRTMSLRDWAAESGLNKCTIFRRLQRGLTPGEAVSLDRSNRNVSPRWAVKYHEYQGRLWTIRELAEKFGIKKTTVHSRLRRGFVIADFINMPPRKGGKQWRRKVDEGVESWQLNMHLRTGDFTKYLKMCRMIDYRMVGRFYKELKPVEEEEEVA